MKHLILLPILLLSSCLATSSDIQDIADRMHEYETGQITSEELASAVDSKVEEVEKRGTRIPTDPLDLALWLAGLGAASVTGTNWYRNRNLPGTKRVTKA